MRNPWKGKSPETAVVDALTRYLKPTLGEEACGAALATLARLDDLGRSNGDGQFSVAHSGALMQLGAQARAMLTEGDDQ